MSEKNLQTSKGGPSRLSRPVLLLLCLSLAVTFSQLAPKKGFTESGTPTPTATPTPGGKTSTVARPSTGRPAPTEFEDGTNRPGQDFRNFDLPRAEPTLCSEACAAEPLCKAFTFVKAGIQGQNARCWLKSSAPQPVNDACCISGVRGASKPKPTKPDGTIIRLRITLQTGSDDLRPHSTVSAFLETDSGRIESGALNCEDPYDRRVCMGFPNNSRRSFTWELVSVAKSGGRASQAGSLSSGKISPSDVRYFGLSFEGRPTGLLTGDNWDLNEVVVEYDVPARGHGQKGEAASFETFTMFRQQGTPFYRFKTQEIWTSELIDLTSQREPR